MPPHGESCLISVVIPTYNRAALVKRAIESVLAQSYSRLEIIVVDDASSDDTADVINTMRDGRIRYLPQQENAGASVSRNIGVQAATGEYVAYLDSDDTWEPTKIERQLAAVNSRSDPSRVVCYTQTIIDNGVSRTYMPRRAIGDKEPIADYILSDQGLIHTSTLLLHKSLALAVPFNSRYRVMEDWDVFLTLEKMDVDWVYVEAPLSIWYAERREGRLSSTSTIDECLFWLREHQASFTEKTKHRFMLKPVLGPLIGRGERKTYAIKIVVDAIRAGAISPTQGSVLAAKILTPKYIRTWLKKLNGNG